MAARTASVTGNLHTPATLGGATWSDGDTLTVNAGVTVTVAAAADMGVSGASGTTALTVSATGALVVNAPLVLRGDLQQNRGSSVSGNAGGSITFTPPGGSTYGWIISASGSGFAQINLAGSSGNYFVVTTTQGGGGNAWLDGATNDGVKITTNYVKWSRFGDSSYLGLNCPNGYMGLEFTLQRTLFNYCGGLKFQYLSGATTADFIVNGVDIRNTLVTGSDEVFRFRHVNTYVSGTRSIRNVTVYQPTGRTAHIVITSASDTVTVSGLYSYNVDFDLTTANGIAEKLHIVMDNPRGSGFLSIGGGSNMTLRDSVFLSHVDNPHYIAEAGDAGLGKNIFYGCLVDGDDYFGTDAGDFVIANAEIEIRNCLLINKAGTLVTLGFAGAIASAFHNTMYRAMGFAIGETTGGANQAKDFKSNLSISPINASNGTDGGDGVHQQTSFVRQALFSYDYNGYFGTMIAAALAYLGFPVKVIAAVTCTSGTTTTLVKASGSTFVTDGVQAGDFFWNTTRSAGARVLSVDSETQLTLASAIAAQVSTDTGSTRAGYHATANQKYGDDGRGLHDINANPNFVDPTRTLATHATSISVTATTVGIGKETVKLNGFDFDGSAAAANASATVDHTLSFVRAGFAPTNVIYQNAGHDLVTTGALEGVFTPSTTTLGGKTLTKTMTKVLAKAA